MDHSDRAAIDTLFRNLDTAARSAPARDHEAEAYIASELARQPNAPYYMLQTIVMQNQALENLQARLAQLEAQQRQPAPAPTSMFGRLFGGASAAAPQPRPTATPARPAPQAAPAQSSGPWGQQPRQSQGGGFLAGAAQTAVGVAGGMLLGNALSNMFSPDEAHAAEAPYDAYPQDEPEAGFEESGFDEGGFDEGGDWE